MTVRVKKPKEHNYNNHYYTTVQYLTSTQQPLQSLLISMTVQYPNQHNHQNSHC